MSINDQPHYLLRSLSQTELGRLVTVVLIEVWNHTSRIYDISGFRKIFRNLPEGMEDSHVQVDEGRPFSLGQKCRRDNFTIIDEVNTYRPGTLVVIFL